MLIGGLQKTTLIDYPAKIACTVFTVGCNFRCPFCHNRDLVNLAAFKKAKLKIITEKEFFAFLETRKKWLDGVCITGGEPTLMPDLPKFIEKIKKMGFLVKLDTNGSNPEMLMTLLKKNLLDYIAMDIKTTFGDYTKVVNLKSQISNLKSTSSWPDRQILKLLETIKESIKLILNSGVDFEFRTTVVPTIHNETVLLKMAEELKKQVQSSLAASGQARFKVQSCKWWWQNFRPKNCVNPDFEKIKPYSEKELKKWLEKIKKILPGARLRGDKSD